MFPNINFETGNVLNLKEEDSSYDIVLFFDLLEHLEPSAINQAIKEMARVAKETLLACFFNIHKIEKNIIKQVRNYHWNTLSIDEITNEFKSNKLSSDIISIDQHLLDLFGKNNYNKNAYILVGTKEL